MLIDGRAMADDAIEALRAQYEGVGPLSLGIVMNEGDKATESFVKIKSRVAERLGVSLVRCELPPDATTEMAIAMVLELVGKTQGVIVQLPLPNGIAADSVLAAIPASHDVDGIRPEPPRASVRPPVAEAIAEIFYRQGVVAARKKAVVVGAGRLVGAPAAELLRDLDAEVTVVTHMRGSLSELKDADIVVLGAGDSGLVKPEMLKEGVVLIDAGTSEQGGRLAGDADPACARVASLFTPVPGGIGPIAVAMIFKNLFVLAKKSSGR